MTQETQFVANPKSIQHHFAGRTVSKSEILDYCKQHKISSSSINSLSEFRTDSGDFGFPKSAVQVGETDAPSGTPGADGVKAHRHVKNTSVEGHYIPRPLDGFVSFGAYEDVRQIIRSRQFMPVLMTGESGLGKTTFIIQGCAVEARELITISITTETDEEDLFGSIGLVEGNTVLNEGPVTTAMRKGHVLLVDELDYASSKIACLQNVLNGGSYTFKKTGEIVYPTAGFNVFATMNTKGKGSEDGRYAHTNVQNEAFLDRFPLAFECDYPPAETECKILRHYTDNEAFISNLTKWAEAIRKTFKEGGCDETMTTRRLINIVRAHNIFEHDITKAIQLGVSRFNKNIQESFIQMYKAIDDNQKNGNNKKEEKEEMPSDFPF